MTNWMLADRSPSGYEPLIPMLDYHREFLADQSRMRAYRDAIRSVVRPGDVVVDLGCGTGALSFLACEAGASHVYAIDQTHMADVAELLTRHLHLDTRISVLHARSTEVTLPEPADVLVTETMGAFAFDEGILGTLLDARARLLAPRNRIIPQSLSLWVAPVDDARFFDERIAWWGREQHGIDLSPLGVFASNSLLFHSPSEATLLSAPATAIRVDSGTFPSADVTGHVSFTSHRAGVLHGFVCWFKALLAEGIELSSRDASSWLCGFLPLEVPLAVSSGSSIEIDIETHDGRVWAWRGSTGSGRFDQTSWLAKPLCAAPESG